MKGYTIRSYPSYSVGVTFCQVAVGWSGLLTCFQYSPPEIGKVAVQVSIRLASKYVPRQGPTDYAKLYYPIR